MRRIAMQSVDRGVQIGLFGFGRDAGRRSRAHHVDDDQRDLGANRETDALDHE